MKEKTRRGTRLEKVFFRIPPMCKGMDFFKTELELTVDRSNPTAKLEDFTSRVEDLYIQMRHQEHLKGASPKKKLWKHRRKRVGKSPHGSPMNHYVIA